MYGHPPWKRTILITCDFIRSTFTQGEVSVEAALHIPSLAASRCDQSGSLLGEYPGSELLVVIWGAKSVPVSKLNGASECAADVKDSTCRIVLF